MNRLVAAVETNNARFLLSMGRAGGGVVRSDAEVQWVVGGSPIDYHNAVIRADLQSAQVVKQFRAALAQHGVPGTWHVGPSMQPETLPETLVAHGFEPGGSEPGMAVKLADQSRARPTDLNIHQVTDFGDYTKVLGAGFGEGPAEARWVGATFSRIGDGAGWRHFVGYVDDEPVATASTLTQAGVVGVYFVSTHPQARRRGYGAAITQRVIRDAELAVLCSSPMGKSVYERLGFREVCTIHLFESVF